MLHLAPWRFESFNGTHSVPCRERDLVGRSSLGALAAWLHSGKRPGFGGTGTRRCVASRRDPKCFLCLGAADRDERAKLVVARGAHTIVMLNRYPYNNGHLLIAPLAHLATLDKLSPDVQLELMQTITRHTDILARRMNAEGFNIGLNLGRVAGAGVPGHLHWHVVPRWSGDTNFMPVIADLRVIPQSLDALLDVLRDEE